MLLQRNRTMFIIFALLAAIIFSGCASQQAPVDEPLTEIEVVEEAEVITSLITAFEVLQADAGELLAYVHGDHWDGALPLIQEGDDLEVDIRVEDSVGEIIYPDDAAISLDVHILDDSEEIVSFDFNDDHLLIEGNQSGETRIFFTLLQDGQMVFQTPPLRVLVVEKAVAEPIEVPEVYSYDLIDRSQDRVTANVHGDHWDGSLPPVTNGEYVSVGAIIKDTQGQNILLDGQPFSLAVRIADQGQEGVVSFDFHGDHLYLIGESAGNTRLVFMLIANDEPVFETPPIAVKVVD